MTVDRKLSDHASDTIVALDHEKASLFVTAALELPAPKHAIAIDEDAQPNILGT